MDSSFIFNGFPFPNFTNRWNLVWNEEAHEVSLPLPVVGVHDIASIICSLDHEGMVESEDFEVFIYAVQEILISIFRGTRGEIEKSFQGCNGVPEKEIYETFVRSLLEIRNLAKQESAAFWTTGPTDVACELVLKRLKASRLIVREAGYQEAPHIFVRVSNAKILQAGQVKTLHRLAQSGTCGKEFRKLLLNLF